MEATATKGNKSAAAAPAVEGLGAFSNLSAILGDQCYFKCRGLVITPPEDMSWKAEKGQMMFMRKVKVLAGEVVVTYKEMGDSTESFTDLVPGNVVSIKINSAKTEKGNIEVMGDIVFE